MRSMEEIMSLNAALTHSMTFKGLDPYQVDNLCETLYAELERMINKTHPKFKAMQLNMAEFKQSHIPEGFPVSEIVQHFGADSPSQASTKNSSSSVMSCTVTSGFDVMTCLSGVRE